MTMANKKARTIEEQLELLKQRGMCFDDDALAISQLKRISYYRLKGYWWDMQQDRVAHSFYPESRWEDVMARYYFDKELRLILFGAIETIEIALRAKMIYHLSLGYGGVWYRDCTLFSDPHLLTVHLKELNNEFQRSRQMFAKDYRRKHFASEERGTAVDGHPDAWILLEVATFGVLSKIYKNLIHQLPQKSTIANEMGLNLHNELSGWLEAITYLRNVIAHHSRVWNINIVKRPPQIHNARMPWLSTPLTEFQAKKPFSVISAMLYLCNAIEPDHTLKQQIFSLFEKYPEIPLHKIGFCNHWEREPVWR